MDNIDYGIRPETIKSSDNFSLLLQEQKRTNSLLQELLNLFKQYDQSYQNEIIKEQRPDLL